MTEAANTSIIKGVCPPIKKATNTPTLKAAPTPTDLQGKGSDAKKVVPARQESCLHLQGDLRAVLPFPTLQSETPARKDQAVWMPLLETPHTGQGKGCQFRAVCFQWGG